MPRLRLAVALLVPDPVATEIDGLRRACGDGSLGRVAPHITLVPPVNVNVTELAVALARLRSAAARGTGPLELRLGRPATFHPDTPVVYLRVHGDGGDLDVLHDLRDAVFEPPLARRLTWPFVPHVTLAEEMDPARIPAAVAALADYEVDVTFAEVALLQEGPSRRWAPIATARIGPPTVVARGGLPVELWESSIADPEVAVLFADEPTVPDGARPFVVTARRERTILGAARGWRRGGEAETTALVVTEAAGLEDVERHLRRAAPDVA
ncbi:MAG: 2'-5' RNA ligase family protein [Acidimicrobiales bacterium]